MKYLKLLLILFLLVSCEKTERPQAPADLLSKEEMADILYDMLIINSAKGSKIKVLQENGIDPDEYVLKKYAIDSTRFVESNAYYAYDFKEYTEIMTAIDERIKKEKESYQEQLDREQAEAKRRTDSLRAVRKKTKESKTPKVKVPTKN